MAHLTRSRDQLEQTAHNLLRQAYAEGWNTDDLAIDYATAAMGEEYRPLIGRVHAREFKTFNPN
jgi:hypothetical protein